MAACGLPMRCSRPCWCGVPYQGMPAEGFEPPSNYKEFPRASWSPPSLATVRRKRRRRLTKRACTVANILKENGIEASLMHRSNGASGSAACSVIIIVKQRNQLQPRESRPRGFHPKSLADPYVTVSRHTAPIVRTANFP
jgi:hypothetical protein